MSSIYGLPAAPDGLHPESDAAVSGGTVPVASDGAKRGPGLARMCYIIMNPHFTGDRRYGPAIFGRLFKIQDLP